MIGGKDRQLGDAAPLIEADVDVELLAASFAGAQEARVPDLVPEIDLEPVGRIMPDNVGVELMVGPFGESGTELGLAAAMRCARLTSEKPPVSTGSVS